MSKVVSHKRHRVTIDGKKRDISHFQLQVLTYRDISDVEGAKKVGKLRVANVFNGLVKQGLARRTRLGVQRTALGTKVLKALTERGK